MRILVTGGAGFIGSHYSRMLAAGTLKGASEIVILDKLTYSGNRANLENIEIESLKIIYDRLNLTL
mgnify:CR=1 FL=1